MGSFKLLYQPGTLIAARDVEFLPSLPSLEEKRLFSLDALRGFTMFWIIGGSELAIAVTRYIYPPLADAVETQLFHATWKGFTALDMVMPIFLFIVGAAMPFALAKGIRPGASLRKVYWRIARRFATLWCLGILIQLLKQVDMGEMPAFELYSNTLQAIAIGYLVASIALIHLRLAGQIVVMVALILGYWALLVFVPFGGHPAGTLDRTANFALYVDMQLLGPFRRDHSFTWIITSLGFSASVLLGAMAGHLLRSSMTVPRRLAAMILLGLTCMACGWMWSYWHPLNRHLWTSSMILWTGGWGFLFLALFHAVIDLAKVRRWAYPLILIGANALLAYTLCPVFSIAVDTIIPLALPCNSAISCVDLLAPLFEISLLWLLLLQLFRHRLFLTA